MGAELRPEMETLQVLIQNISALGLNVLQETVSQRNDSPRRRSEKPFSLRSGCQNTVILTRSYLALIELFVALNVPASHPAPKVCETGNPKSLNTVNS